MSQSRTALAISLAIHVAVVFLMFTVVFVGEFHPLLRPQPTVFVTQPRSVKLKLKLAREDGGGGGGKRDPLPPQAGDLPKPPRHRIFVPPDPNPPEGKIFLEAAFDIPADTPVPTILGKLGDPWASGTLPSAGPGGPSGFGGGQGDRVGDRRGPGLGNGNGRGVQGRFLGGVTAPVVIYRLEPEYSEEARKAKYQGTVVLAVEIDTAGRPTDIRVVQALGLGLDQKAVDAVAKWKFRPARKEGRAIAFPATIEVNFRLL